MKKEHHAVILFGLLTFQQSKQVLQHLGYEDRKRLIQLVAYAPIFEQEERLDVANACLSLLTTQEAVDKVHYQAQLQQLAHQSPQRLARYIQSLIQTNSSPPTFHNRGSK